MAEASHLLDDLIGRTRCGRHNLRRTGRLPIETGRQIAGLGHRARLARAIGQMRAGNPENGAQTFRKSWLALESRRTEPNMGNGEKSGGQYQELFVFRPTPPSPTERN